MNENVDYPTSGLSAMPILFVNIFHQEFELNQQFVEE